MPKLPANPSPKHERAAMLLAEGLLSQKDVAKAVGFTPSGLRLLAKRPEFQLLLERYQEKLFAGTEERVKRELVADAPTNLGFLKATRDGNFTDNEKVMGVRLKAGLALWDRQVPKRDEGEGRGGVTIVLNQAVTEKLVKAEAEEGEFDDGDA